MAIFITIAYVDTKNLKEYFAQSKILKEYESSPKLVGIGIIDQNGEVKINEVIYNTPAEKSGLKIGDIIINIDGQKAKSAKMLEKYINYTPKNQKIALTIRKPDKSVVEILLLPTSLNNFE